MERREQEPTLAEVDLPVEQQQRMSPEHRRQKAVSFPRMKDRRVTSEDLLDNVGIGYEDLRWMTRPEHREDVSVPLGAGIRKAQR